MQAYEAWKTEDQYYLPSIAVNFGDTLISFSSDPV